MASRRVRPINFKSFVKSSETAIMVWLMLLVLISVIGPVWYGLKADSNSAIMEERSDIAYLVASEDASVNEESPSAQQSRRENAQNLLLSRPSLLDTDDMSKSYWPFSDYQTELIENVAETGDPLPPDRERYKWGEYFRPVYLWPGLPLFLMSLALFCLVNFAYRIWNTSYLADLPWRRGWPVLVLVLSGPIGWICFAVSAFRMHNNLVKPTPRAVVPETHQTNQDIGNDYLMRRHAARNGDEEEGEIVVETSHGKNYNSSPQVARKRYVEFRTGLRSRMQQRRISEIDRQLTDLKDELQEHSDSIRENQTATNKLKATRRELEAALAEENEQTDLKVVNEEFDRLLALPGVLAVQVVNQNLRLIIRSVIEHYGHDYDGGDWRIDIGPDCTELSAVEIRSGVRNDWEGGYPVYRNYGKTFCFGSRHELIMTHLAKGQYLECIALVVECFNTVNDEHSYNVPRAYKRLEQHVPTVQAS